MCDTIATFTDANFADAALRNPLPVVVDFWAISCGPCRALSPIIAEVARELTGKIVIGKVNVEENPQTSARYGVANLPTLLFFKAGRVVSQHTGLLAKKSLVDKIAATFGV